MTKSYQPRHEFAIEMRGPNEPLTSADLNQLEQLYLCAQNQAQLDASGEDKPSASEKTVREEPSELQQACAMFDELWELYPKQLGYHKVSVAQKLKLYRTGYDLSLIHILSASRSDTADYGNTAAELHFA